MLVFVFGTVSCMFYIKEDFLFSLFWHSDFSPFFRDFFILCPNREPVHRLDRRQPFKLRYNFINMIYETSNRVKKEFIMN